MTTLTLLNNVDVDTVGQWQKWNGGAADIFVTADDFGGGGIVTLQRSNDQVIAVPVKFTDDTLFQATENSSFPASGWSPNTWIRATLAGATTPVNVKVIV